MLHFVKLEKNYIIDIFYVYNKIYKAKGNRKIKTKIRNKIFFVFYKKCKHTGISIKK